DGSTDGSVKTALATPFADYKAKFADVLEHWTTRAPGPEEVEAARDSLQHFYAKASIDLERLLDKRIGGFESDQARNLAIAVLLFIVAGMGVLSMVLRQIVKPLDTVTAAMDGLARGQRDTIIPCLDRQDELGTLAAAMQVFKANAETMEN